ncbi:MAG: rod shape-determining protein MreD [Lachnospira eligens]
MFAGFFAGIMYDLFYSGLFGFTALIFIYIGYFSGFFNQKYEVRKFLSLLHL